MGEGKKKVARKEEGTKEIRSHHSHIAADSLFIEGRTAAADISVAGSSRPSSVAPLLSLLSPHSGAFQRAFHAKYRIGNAETPGWMK